MKGKLGEYLSYGLHVITFITYFILIFSSGAPPMLRWLQYPGMVVFMIGIIFLVFSFVGQHRKEEETLLDTGIYGIIRHPMYLGAILLFISMALFLPIWVMILLCIINGVIITRFIEIEDHNNLEKFGEAYEGYSQRVPKVNFITGFFKWLGRKKLSS